MPNASHCLCRTASAGSIDSFAPAHSAVRPARLSRSIPMGSIDSTASRILALRAARPSHRVPPHFDELRRPANLALQVTFNVIYPAAPAYSRVDSFAPAHSDIRAFHCAAPRAGAELVAFVTNLRLPICISASPAALDRYPSRLDRPCRSSRFAPFRIETHSLPSSFAASHRGFAFCLDDPIGSAADFKKAR
jgi:hypothetical protein